MANTSGIAHQPNGSAIPEDYSRLVERIKVLSCKAFNCEVELVGHHPAFVEAVRELERFASSDEPVLISGESGVGKELFAKALHVLGNCNGQPRWINYRAEDPSTKDITQRGQPFVPVNCSRFGDEDLMLSELFGHLKGSFTGAIGERLGVFQTANKGTVFLDEVGELSPQTQSRLLRVLEQKEITPLGSDQTRHVDARVISATNRDLHAMIKCGRFRKDLLYRLGCLPLRVPALRERGDDRMVLLEYFLAKAKDKYKTEKRLTEEALEFVQGYSFPGNVRELKNMVEAGYCLSTNELITLQNITTGRPHRRACDRPTYDIRNYYNRMVRKRESFWDVVGEPFLQRELNRGQVQAIVEKGLQHAGDLKELCGLFNLHLRDYKRFLNFLNTHNLKPNDQPSNKHGSPGSRK